ncbi:MAG: hypothetical protein LBT10_00020 [Methanobrevibacter sp.]|nr:hypothetical protein [Methanobrevibacter sp.]
MFIKRKVNLLKGWWSEDEYFKYFLKSSTPYTTIWSDINWIKIEKYVNKLQKRI